MMKYRELSTPFIRSNSRLSPKMKYVGLTCPGYDVEIW